MLRVPTPTGQILRGQFLRGHILRGTIALMAFAFVASSCGKKSEDMTPVKAGETVAYKDMVLKFGFKAPKNWVAESIPGKHTGYYSTAATETRFQKFTEGDFGARVEVGSAEHTSKEMAMAAFKESFEGVTFKDPVPTTLGGAPAMKIAYSQSGDEDALTGYRIFADKDSLMTYFDAATFGEKRMAKYKEVFDMSEKSVVVAYTIKVDASGKLDSASEAQMMEDMKPSETFSNYNGSSYTIEYPNNFNIKASGKGAVIKGDRNDATIQIDMLENPGKADLDKFVKENSEKIYRGAAVQNATVGGQAAKMINYSFDPRAGSRAYFVMKGTSVYRVTINWPASLEAAYKPSLEKAATSFKAK